MCREEEKFERFCDIELKELFSWYYIKIISDQCRVIIYFIQSREYS